MSEHPSRSTISLQHTTTHPPHCNTVQRTATHCNTSLAHIIRAPLAGHHITARHCKTLQDTATQELLTLLARPSRSTISPQDTDHTATHCNTLQHKSNSHCQSTPHGTPYHFKTLQHTATHCNTLQHKSSSHCQSAPHGAPCHQ